MGEPVWTTFKIGGKATKAIWDQLEELADGMFEESSKDLGWQGMRNFGQTAELQNFCIANKLTFHTHWAAAAGSFDSGIEYWNPSLESVESACSNDDGEPVVSVSFLTRALDSGRKFENIMKDLQAACVERVPAVEIMEEEMA